MAGFGEFEFIAELLAPLAADGAFGLTDDAAVLPDLPSGERWVTTLDTMVAGVHFNVSDPPELIARKLVRVNISDLCSMGAQPVGYMLSLSLNESCNRDWLTQFCSGLEQDQDAFGWKLFGGDTTSTPGPVSLSLTALGSVPEGQELRRNGARPGDSIWVSGTFGDAALGLHVLQQNPALDPIHTEFLCQRYWLPRPDPATGIGLRRVASACLDVSDGLIADLGHIALQSGVGIRIDAEAVPLSKAAHALIALDEGLALLPLSGGDDYELVFACPNDADLSGLRRDLTCIGEVIEGQGVTVHRHGQPLSIQKPGWRHF